MIPWYVTTESEPWQLRDSIEIVYDTEDIYKDIIITENCEQLIEGFGTCLNELGWDALNLLPQPKKDDLIKELFAPDEGVCLGFCRIPVGANDYSRDWYSHNETDGDFSMSAFSIERDKEILLPYISAVKAVNPSLRLWASPWSPPTWMKTNRHYANKVGDHNDLTEDNQVLIGDQFIQKPEYLKAYALYLSKFCNAYKNEGVDIEVLMFQNEPYTLNQWPNCIWTPEGMRNFIANYLGPKFSEDNRDVNLWFGTLNTDRLSDIEYVMKDREVRKFIHGIGLQWEGREIVADVHKLYPDIQLMQTENECGEGTFDWESAEHTFDLLKKYFDGGVNAYMYWNAVLADNGTSSWGWNQNAMVTIDSVTKEIIYNPEFYVMKHLSHFVKKGAVKLKTEGEYSDILAFKNPDNSIIIVLANKSSDDKIKKISIGNKILKVNLPKKSFNTIVYNLND